MEPEQQKRYGYTSYNDAERNAIINLQIHFSNEVTETKDVGTERVQHLGRDAKVKRYFYHMIFRYREILGVKKLHTMQ
jgi:hypothetical protein